MATKHCRCRQNVADAINVLNVFVTHVHPIRFPNETNFRALIARQGRTNERTNERANQMNEGIFEFVIIARTHTHAYHPTHICRSPHNVDNHNANIKVKVFLCTAKINTQKLNTAERAHALQILTIYCLPISLRRYSFREQGVRKCLKLLLLC